MSEKLKAAFIYKFADYIEWPHDILKNQISFSISVLGNGSVFDALEMLKSDRVKGHPLILKKLNDFGDIKFCHILFIGSTQQDRLEEVLNTVNGLQVLTIGDMPGFAERGGIIQLEKKGENVHFKINLDASKKNKLKISSKLLRLATIVSSKNKEGQP